MQPPRIVGLVDETRVVGHDVGVGQIVGHVDGLDLECLDDALGLGIVMGIAAPTPPPSFAVRSRGSQTLESHHEHMTAPRVAVLAR